jgi:hypothetical protein
MEFGSVDLANPTNTKVNMPTTKKAVTVFLLGQVVTRTRATTSMTCGMDMARCIGTMAAFTKVIGSGESNMAKVLIE